MSALGYNDWIKYGWGNELSDIHGTNNALILDFTECGFEDNPLPVIAGISTVKLIKDTCPPPYTLMCSGGVDSQAMLWAWHLSGVPFNVCSVVYEYNEQEFNTHDLLQLKEFCKLHRISINFEYFNIVDFLENDLLSTSLMYDCQSPQICTYIRICDFVEAGTILFSGNFLTKHHSALNYTLLGLQRYADKEIRKKIIPYFFLYTPELAYSFQKNNILPVLSYTDKCMYYKRMGYPVMDQTTSFTGFENIKEYYQEIHLNRINLADKVRYMRRPSDRVFDILFRYKLETGDNPPAYAPIINKIL